MKTRILLTVAFCIIAVFTLKPVAAVDQQLGIGSKAPALDIEHWIQDGNGFFKPVTDFSEGKVYVVEFWATWCGPCVASIPHIAELQNKYRGRGVQIVSVSDEDLETVSGLLDRENAEVGKTFREITSAYSLTTDPDQSVYKSYMDASGQQGIPTSFIVGKTGLVEWIGHPMELDEPLEAVVTDSWDREAFKKELKAKEEFERTLEKISRLAGSGRLDEAIKVAEDQLARTEVESIKEEWVAIRNSLKLSAGQLDEDVLAFFRKQLKSLKGNPEAVGRYGFSMFNAMQQGAKVGPLLDEIVVAIEAEVDSAEGSLKPLLNNTVALLQDAAGNTEAAIKAQQAALDSATASQKRHLQPFMDQLKKKLEE